MPVRRHTASVDQLQQFREKRQLLLASLSRRREELRRAIFDVDEQLRRLGADPSAPLPAAAYAERP